jgi:glyoxylase-like metal-dependent hydrolase (beta-lactamase superfamily II)
MNLKWKVGDTTITKITEIFYSEFPDLIPAATPEVVKKVPWLFPHFVTPEGKLSVSIHSLVVDTPSAKLVVDTCIGNGRDREPFSIMSNLSTSYLEDMIAAGYPPESINYVLCTHLHLDHVGWNTRLVNGKWVPTFPKASYLMDKKDIALYGAIDENDSDAFMQMQRRTFGDSVQPVFDAGLAKPVEGPAEVCDGVRLVPTPGHTPGHYSVLVESKGEKALITGDFMHHPIQFHDPALSIFADVDSAAAIATRRRVFAEYADTPTLIIGTHFAGPTAGKLVRDGDGYRLNV